MEIGSCNLPPDAVATPPKGATDCKAITELPRPLLIKKAPPADSANERSDAAAEAFQQTG